jgi:hypothetical protein
MYNTAFNLDFFVIWADEHSLTSPYLDFLKSFPLVLCFLPEFLHGFV